jgi:anti-sigma B factor antagonist
MTETTVTLTGGAATVTLRGELEMAATFTVEPALERVLQTPELKTVTLDLSAVTFIDSVGLGVVTQLAHEVQARAIALRIVRGPRHVQRVFEVAGLTDALPFDGDQAT